MTKQMTKAEMRVEIAKDVIKQIHAEWYWGQIGVYVSGDPRPVSTAIKGKCSVCAIGAMFLSRFRLFNKQDDDTCSDHMKDRLLEHFTGHQLALVEGAFERVASWLHPKTGEFVNFGSGATASVQSGTAKIAVMTQPA